MDKKIIISIVVNALITAVVVFSRDYQGFAAVLAPAFVIALIASIIGAVLIATGRKKQGALMVCAGCALFVPAGIIGIRGALPVLKEEGAGVWGTMRPWIIEAVVLIPLVVGMAIIAGTDIDKIASTRQTWLVRLKLVVGGSRYSSSVRDEIPDALGKAAMNNDIATFRLLLEHGADVKSLHPGTVQTFRDPALFRLAIEKGLDINKRDERGNTPLISAAHGAPPQGYYEKDAWKKGGAIINLLEHKADVNAKNNDGITALMHVFIMLSGYRGDERLRVPFGPLNKDVPLLLLDGGADVNARDNEGNSVLLHAIENVRLSGPGEQLTPEDIEVLSLLIQRKADVNAANKNGSTPRMIAQQIRNPESRDRVLKLLMKAGTRR